MSDELLKIKEKWNLPKVYLDFLATHKKEQYIEGENFVNELRLYGESDLIKNQGGYSYNPIKKIIINDWPKDYVVIGDDGADPYVLDLSRSDGNDAPVLFSYHGETEWSFEEYAASFAEFINTLALK